MKIISTSDWHIGNLFHGNDRLPEHRHFFNWLLDRIEEYRPDGLLVAGDVFDTANPSAAAQSVYYDFITAATDRCPRMKVIISAGNHDSAFRLQAPRAMLSKLNVEVRGAVKRSWKHDENGGAWVFDYDDLMIPLTGNDGETVVVLVVPFLRSDIAMGVSYSEGVNRFLRELTREARMKYPGKKLVMMAHMYAKGSDIASEDASEKIVIGGQEEVNMEGWEDHPEYLTSGHIHKRQHLWDTNWARYTGSILPMSFSEIDYRHGVDLLTFSTGERPEVKFLEYIPQHRLRILPEDDEELSPKKMLKVIKDKLEDRKDDDSFEETFEYVLLKVKIDKISNDEIKELENIFKTKNAVLCKIQRIMPRLDLSTLSGRQQIVKIDDIVNRDPLDTLKEAFIVEHGREMNERQEKVLRTLISTINRED